MKTKKYQLALSMLKGVGAILFKQLIDRFGSAKNIFNLNSKELCATYGIGKSLASTILKKDTLQKAEVLLESYAKENIQIICYEDPTYPTRLKHIPDPPPVLYYSNKINLNSPKIISIVGTRNATPYGKDIVEKLIKELSLYNVLIVSGLAYGIDIHAHEVSMKYNLPTVGIMASGLDVIYPFYHKKTAAQMMKKGGGIISEYGPKVLPEHHHFPVRNRIIAGISDATIVVEAGKKSGAIITAMCANQYNREVFAVPGSIGKNYSQGCNNLIKRHQAHLLTSIDDLAYIMNWDKQISHKQQANRIKCDMDNFTKEEKYTVQTLAKFHRAIGIKDLSLQTKINPTRLSAIALHLELKNIVEVLPGSKYRLRVA